MQPAARPEPRSLAQMVKEAMGELTTPRRAIHDPGQYLEEKDVPREGYGATALKNLVGAAMAMQPDPVELRTKAVPELGLKEGVTRIDPAFGMGSISKEMFPAALEALAKRRVPKGQVPLFQGRHTREFQSPWWTRSPEEAASYATKGGANDGFVNITNSYSLPKLSGRSMHEMETGMPESAADHLERVKSLVDEPRSSANLHAPGYASTTLENNLTPDSFTRLLSKEGLLSLIKRSYK
jgi:hypothetical protein